MATILYSFKIAVGNNEKGGDYKQ